MVFERHASGAIHFHIVLFVGCDIRTGFDWSLAEAAYAAGKERNYTKAGKLWGAAANKAVNGAFLREQWAFWRGLSKRYRWLGRCEMLPVKSTAEAVAKYTGGYIAKHMQHRRPEDKGVRLVRVGKGMRFATCRIAFNSPRARLFRRKLAAFAAQPHIRAAGVHEYEDMKQVFGKRWGYHLLIPILAMELDSYPTGAEARADGHCVPLDAFDIQITRHRSSDYEFERYVRTLKRREIVLRIYGPKQQNEELFSSS